MKSLAYMVRDGKSPAGNEIFRPLLVLMRGNDQMNEAKLSSAIKGREFRPMTEDEIVNFFHSPAGYLGPVGLERVRVIENKGTFPLQVKPIASSSLWTKRSADART